MTVPEIVTLAVLQAMAPYTPKEKLAPLVQPLNEEFAKRKVDKPITIAAILAELYEESDHFRATEEYASGEAYEGRRDLGNTQPGDGVRYKGRALVMNTGRLVYDLMSTKTGQDFINHPELMAQPPWSVVTSFLFLDLKENGKCWQAAAEGDMYTLTLLINGGLRGYAVRLEGFIRAMRALGIKDGWDPRRGR